MDEKAGVGRGDWERVEGKRCCGRALQEAV